MKVKIDIDSQYNENYVTIHVQEWTEEIEELVNLIKHKRPRRVIGIREEQTMLLDPAEIEYVYAEKRKVYAYVNQQSIEIKAKLYELERTLEPFYFTRFSKSVIGNIQLIDRFEVSFNGNLCVIFKSGSREYVSRNYVHQLKERLLLGGE